jgi:predicted TPR repeat methyltransferase
MVHHLTALAGRYGCLMDEPSPLDATKTFYDFLAGDYAERLNSDLTTKPLDRSMLDAFAESVLTANLGPVADLGCGCGRVTAYLANLGLDVWGLDLSPTMVALARQAYPNLRFDEGSFTALDLAQGSLGVTIHLVRRIELVGASRGRR